jgi:hypothetical protein
MFVITADQIDSRSTTDVAGSTRDSINRTHGERLLLPADRNAGDEIQALTGHADTALALVLELTRAGQWSVGLGCGGIRLPLPSATREASGEAFFAARDAVARAKKMQTRLAIEARAAGESAEAWPRATDAEALVNLLLLLRERRSPAGWELYDLLAAGMAQNEAAARLGITPPSVSSRARAAGIRVELASIGPLTRLLENLDRASTGMDAPE